MLLFVTGYSCLMSTQLHEHKQPPYKKRYMYSVLQKYVAWNFKNVKLGLKLSFIMERNFNLKYLRSVLSTLISLQHFWNSFK